MYYLQSRYYNPEWGRFINADGLIGQTGELLGHNLFMYCKNNPVLLKDENGFRPMVATNWDDEIAISRGLPIQTVSQIVKNSNSKVLPNKNQAFNYGSSAAKGVKSGALDELASVGADYVVKGTPTFVEYGKVLGGYVSKYSVVANVARKTIGVAGTIAFTVWDVKNSINDGEYFGATLDVVSGLLGFGAGYYIGLGGTALIAAGAPAVLIGALGFGMCIGAGVVIDRISSGVKDNYYGR